MKPLTINIFLACFIAIPVSKTFSQQCEVETKNLIGTYSGECKKGKAHGKGIAKGTDMYDGEFKSGLPDGPGTYTWNNKNFFAGKYVKGLREGKGVMTYKKEKGQDSVVEGFWKKDIYYGKYEKPWEVFTRTGSVKEVNTEYFTDDNHLIKIVAANTTGGSTNIGGVFPRATISNIIILKGSYDHMTTLDLNSRSTETKLVNVSFPFRAKIQMEREEIEMEFFEPGRYHVTISVNK
jgi:hypothetical protein